MWDLHDARPLGRLSMRKLIALVAACFVATFAYSLLITTTAHAADVVHNGASLTYNNNTYGGPTRATGSESYNLPAGTQIYQYIEAPGQVGGNRITHMIYFGPNEDTNKATSAKYVEYIFTPPSSYSQPSNQRDVTVAATGQAADNNGQGTESNDNISKCTVAGGLSWIICPLSQTLAGATDFVYKTIANFMITQPLQTTQQGSLYMAWSLVRNLANVIFIISFVIIIYSQLTNYGISNYGIKKMLPRLIVAAVLVNISYYIAALAIDLSNVTGSAMYDGLQSIQANIAANGQTPTDGEVFNWTSVVGVILAGGAGATALGIGIASAIAGAGGVITAMIYMVLPLLVGLFLAILVVLLILAARHALIIALVVVSPLAFVAYLLPGTEKWFDRWKDLFITMLIFYPAFAFVFAGAQLAGSIIMQNASGPNALNMIVLGMAVQVAPLIITPLLLKLSGGVLGRIAMMVNNPNKGVLDRTKNWANARAEMHKQRGLGNGQQLSRAHFLRNYARRREGINREIKEKTANYTTMADNVYNSSRRHARQDMLHREVEEQKEIIQKQLDLKWNGHVQIDPHALEQDLKLRVLSDEVSRAKGELDKRYENLKAGQAPMHGEGYEGPQSRSMVELLNRATDTTQALAIQSMATQAAKNAQSKQLTEALISNSALQAQAGGIAGKEGADIALAQAINTQRSDFGKNVEAARSIMKHFNFSTDDKQAHALGTSFDLTDTHGNKRAFSAADIYTREAAIEDQLKAAPFSMGDDIIKMASHESFKDFRETIASTMESAGWSSKAAYYDGEATNAIRQGKSGDDYFKQHAAELVAQGKISPKVLAENHKNASAFVKVAIEDLRAGNITIDMAKQLNPKFASFNDAVSALKTNANTATTDPRLNVGLGDDREAVLRDIYNNL